MSISFDVNNQRRIELVQTKHDGDVLVTVFDGDDYDEYTIDPGDFVMLLNHYRCCKHTGADIVQDDYIIGLRWFSWSNPEMDVVYLVKNKDWAVATEANQSGV